MAWSYHSLVPADPWHVPPPDRSENAVAYLRANVHNDVECNTHELPGLIGNPWVTRFMMKCPSCGTIGEDFEWVVEALNESWDNLKEDRDAVRPLAPCCNRRVSIFDLTFPCPWADESPDEPAWRLYEVGGFSCYSITLTNPDQPINYTQLQHVIELLACPMKLIFNRS